LPKSGATVVFAASQPGVTVEVTNASINTQATALAMDVTVPKTTPTTAFYVEISNIAPSLTPSDSDVPKIWSVGQNAAGASFKLTAGLNKILATLNFKDCRCYSESLPYLNAEPLQVSIWNTPQQYLGYAFSNASPQLLAIFENDAVLHQLGYGPGQTSDEAYAATAYPIDHNLVTPPWDSNMPGLSIISAAPSPPDSNASLGYSWEKKVGESVTAFDTAWKDRESSFEFYSGVFLGIAGGGAISLVVELFNAIEKATEERGLTQDGEATESVESRASGLGAGEAAGEDSLGGLPLQPNLSSQRKSLPPAWLGGLVGAVAAEWLRKRIVKRARR
jgi:hypothetical protein